ncbi:hypothetical protein BC2230_21309 [Burkholderia cepacia]
MLCRIFSSVPESGSAANEAPHASAHAAKSRGRPKRAMNRAMNRAMKRGGKGMTGSVASGDSYVAKDKITATYVKNWIPPIAPAGRTGHQGNSQVEIGEKRVV